ncbi:recQ-mediated genome instability protein 1, partial [Tieghemiomyces parasiticus]
MPQASLPVTLANRAVRTQDAWLQACVAFVEGEDPSCRSNEQRTLERVYQQFLFVDLAESSRPVLPTNCSELHNAPLPAALVTHEVSDAILAHALVLQVEDVVDIGLPILQLVDRLEEIEVHRKALLLNVSDTARQVLAEGRPLPHARSARSDDDEDGGGEHDDEVAEDDAPSAMRQVLLDGIPGQPSRNMALPRGTLKWVLSDGYRRIPAMEYRPLRQLDITLPLGFK